MVTVSNYLRTLIEKQVQEKGLIVWFDPEGHYTDFAAGLSIPDTAIALCGASFFAVRHQIEPLMGGDKPPRIVLYVPRSEEETEDALIEIVAAGVVMKPGQAPNRNTRLSVVAKAALRDMLAPKELERLAKQIESGKLTLAELDAIKAGNGVNRGVISTIFGTSVPQQVALEYLGSRRYDGEITRRHALEEIAQLFAREYGFDFPLESSPDKQREALSRHALATEFSDVIAQPVSAQISALKVASGEGPRAACVALVRAWRLRRDLRESYATYAARLSSEIRSLFSNLTLEQIGACETFVEVEAQLQTALETRLVQESQWQPEATKTLRQTIDTRLAGFWASWPDQYPEVAARWHIIKSGLDVLSTASEIEKQLKTAIGGPTGLLKQYTSEWCLLDTHHRHLERRCHQFEFDATDRYQSTEKLIARARQRYMEVAGSIAGSFAHALERTKFVVSGQCKQVEIYSRFVRTAILQGKTAYVLVDALRYEMARELAETLQNDFGVQLTAAIGTVPTITPIGMAALMPGAESDAKIVPLGGGTLGLRVGGNVLKDRTSRVAWFKSNQSGVVAVEKLEDILLNFKEAKKSELRKADVILVTSQEIDQAGESATVRAARRTMEDILGDLAKLVRKLAEYSCTKIIITADHGYVFGDEPDTDMKIPPPSGQKVSLHTRAWIGKGGHNSDAYLRTRLSLFGLDDDQELEIAVPYGFGVFVVPGGAGAYYHGGMSPQEMTIPVLELTPKLTSAVPLTQVELAIALGTKKISTRFCSIQVTGHASSLVDVQPPQVRAELRAGVGVISQTVSASYGFIEATGDVQLEFAGDSASAIVPNTITLMITEEKLPPSVSLHLIDAVTGLAFAVQGNIEVAISI